MELKDVAKAIKEAKEKIFLVYAFNATGKTRLSVGYKELCRNEEGHQTGVYFNAFSEDLFVWDNDINNAEENIRMKVMHSSLNNLHLYIDENKVREKLKPYNVKFVFDFLYTKRLQKMVLKRFHFSEKKMKRKQISRYLEVKSVSSSGVSSSHSLTQKVGQTSKMNTFLLMIPFQVLMTIISL